jgi:hypothetical protein
VPGPSPVESSTGTFGFGRDVEARADHEQVGNGRESAVRC